jgi:hypothetical protein
MDRRITRRSIRTLIDVHPLSSQAACWLDFSYVSAFRYRL